jgi:hypothetical protein
MKIFRVTASSSPKVLANSTQNTSDQKLIIKNIGATLIYFGRQDVSVNSGYPLSAGAEITLKGTNEAIYIISSGADSAVAGIVTP